MANLWFKFYGTEYLSDQKIERLNPVERSCWITLLCLASANDNGEIRHLTVQTLLNKSGIQFDPYHPEQWEEALSIFEKLEMLEMITRKDTGTILITNWEKRQEHNLTVAERVAKSREKAKCNKNVTTDVTNVTTEENRIEENRIDNTKILVTPPEMTKTPPEKKIQNKEKEEVAPFTSETWIASLMDSPQEHIALIGYYFFRYSEHNFPNKAVATEEMKKNLVPATWLVKNFTGEEIKKTMVYCKKNFADVHWNLSTVKKQITYVTSK